MDVSAELAKARDADRIARLGLAGEAAEVAALLDRAAEDADLLAEVADAARDLAGRVGEFRDHGTFDPCRGEEVAVLALLATVDAVRAEHRARGVPDDVSWATLADLGQQVAVHRATFGGFGLHTRDWLRVAWSGGLYWLGRLQFELLDRGGEWYLSVHIPETGPLGPDVVDASLARARAFFATHFDDHRPAGFHCASWLLDPRLTEVLAESSNMARFQRRWRLEPGGRAANGEAIFFVFRRRDGPDPATLPRDTSLQRAIADHIADGGHWYVRDGTIELDPGDDADQPAKGDR
ncbi:hypothetical protein GGQ54_002525 [Naumannella cuiyingiana]|uniref:GNAT-like C-terminal domain-containing protein n=1 Tax=Naumannella cuiyingiana TaxID=1347891 RepID=A0A7Z0DAG2_9ACTN|nr:hypothetical protein [Naumannella cuiyingiana]